MEFKFGYSNIPKGSLTDPIMDNGGLSNEWYRKSAAIKINSYLIFDILEKAKTIGILNETSVHNEDDYVATVLKYSEQMRLNGLHPILIAETNIRPAWLLNWRQARWSNQITLPDGLYIKYLEKESRHKNYLFHINNVPVYAGLALIGGSLLLPVESLKLLKLKK